MPVRLARPIGPVGSLGPLLTVALGIASCAVAPSDRVLFDGVSLDGFAPTRFGGEGAVVVEDGDVVLEPGSPLTGLHWVGEALPREDYEVELTAARVDGSDFFCGLTVPVGEQHATLVLGGWGGATCGLSCIDGRDASENETTCYRGFERGRRYAVRLRVAGGRIAAWLDGELLFDVGVAGRELSLRPEVSLSAPFGVACFATRAAIGPIVVRPVTPR